VNLDCREALNRQNHWTRRPGFFRDLEVRWNDQWNGTEGIAARANEVLMTRRPKLIAGFIAALAILIGPGAQASSWSGAASSASQAANSAAQSAVRNARDDAARRALAQQHWNNELRRTRRHSYDYNR
jgi:hypothetical protein